MIANVPSCASASIRRACLISLAALLAVHCSSGAPIAPTDAASNGADASVAAVDASVTATRDASTNDSGIGNGADAGLVADAGVGCGERTGQRGLTPRTMTVAGLARTWLAYLPGNLDPKKPVPLLYVHHGYTMSGQGMHDITGYSDLADAEGFAVLYPDGEAGPDSTGAPWNVGTGVCGVGITVEASGDDFDFVSQMRADLEQDQCIDADHVFMAGFSMGAFFSHHVGCMRPDLARAIAPHSGGTHDFSNCVPGHRPVIIMHGNIDGIIPVGCDEPGALIPTGSTPSATLWIQKNGCSADSDDIPVLNGICHVYRNCPADGQVELCVFDAMDHCWAGGSTAGHDAIFACPDYESATQLQWQFFKKYAW